MFQKIKLGNRIVEFYERTFRLLGKDCTSIFSDLLEMDTSKKNSHISYKNGWSKKCAANTLYEPEISYD